MPIVEGGTSAVAAGVGAESQSALHVTTKPDPCGVLGHYKTSHRTVLVNSQAANSRLFELRNNASNLVVIHKVRVEVTQTAANTAAIMDSIDMYKLTGHTAVSTTNTVTLVASRLRTSFAAPPGGVDLRGCTVAGIAAGMTGGTMTKDTAPLRQFGIWFLAAVPTGGPTVQIIGEYWPDVGSGESPLILAQNEGMLIENRVLLGAAAGAAVSIDIEWAEVTAY